MLIINGYYIPDSVRPCLNI